MNALFMGLPVFFTGVGSMVTNRFVSFGIPFHLLGKEII